ncbi:MAG: hypothetical protein J6M23_02000 [Bacteroidales bacterium]|nr:hypothetical protein [Bacteroidales bacterium]
MTGRFLSYGMWSLTAALGLLSGLVSCQRHDGVGSRMKQAVNLSLSVGMVSTTKVDVSSFTEADPLNPVFRGMVDIRLVPFAKKGTITLSEQANGFPLALSGFYSLSPGLSAYYYTSGVDAWFPMETASLLLYGKAPGDFGALKESGFTGHETPPDASSFVFSPVAMAPGGTTPQEAKLIAAVLNGILLANQHQVEAHYGEGKSKMVSVVWNDNVEDSNLRGAYKQITNEGAFIPGSGPLVEALLSGLYGFLKNYESHNTNVYEVVVDGVPYEASYEVNGEMRPLLYKNLYNGLRDDILGKFRTTEFLNYATVDDDTFAVRFKDESVRTFPENLGLPSGCAILRWTPAGFVVPQVNGVEGIAPMNRYCFPPALYYYANTTLRTSQDDNIGKSYTEKGYTQWSQVLADYTLGEVISSNTKSVALVQPAQFGVGMLSATVKASRSWLQDNDGLPETTVDATGENLPLTGIILSGQFPQRFDFTPIYSGSEDDVEYYLYDKQVPGVFLTSETSAPIRTLSLQTPDDLDLYFTLEFRNDSGKTFYGADGRVLPGRKFYMVGKLELPPQPRAFNSVFVKGHYTTVTCTIHSLDGAYNAVPDLGVPQLTVGVQTQVNWTLASPTTIILE